MSVDNSETISRLFASPMRWGYEYVPPEPAAESPERGHPPEPEQVRMVSRAQAAGLPKAAAIAAASTACILILDSEIRAFSIGEANRPTQAATIISASLLAAIVSFWVVRVWQRSATVNHKRADLNSASLIVPAALVATTCFFVPYFVLPVEAFLLWRHTLQRKHDLVADPQDAKAAQSRYRKAEHAWRQSIARFDEIEASRAAATDVWYPVPFSETTRMTCVFGGSAESWTALLTTLGASLIGAEANVTIGDLTGRSTIDVLCDACDVAGFAATEAVFPNSLAGAELFDDLSWDELSSVLAEVLHAAQRDQNTSRRERTEDREVIREVITCLDRGGRVSIGRLHVALTAIRGFDATGASHSLSPGEHSRLTALFDGTRPEHPAAIERVIRIERTLRGFEALGRGASHDSEHSAADSSSPTGANRQARLFVIGVDKRADDLEHEQRAELLYQLLLRRVRLGRAQADVLFILGADRIGPERLKSLQKHAEQQQIKLVLFFESLTRHAIELVGAGGAAASFLALGNHLEAEQASRFIGAQHMWVVTQQTIAAGESLAATQSQEESTSASGSVGLPPSLSAGLSKSRGRSYSETFGKNTQYTQSNQRVYEAIITPDVLQRLPPMGMIHVEVQPDGRRAISNVDCNPQLAYAPRVSHAPRNAA